MSSPLGEVVLPASEYGFRKSRTLPRDYPREEVLREFEAFEKSCYEDVSVLSWRGLLLIMALLNDVPPRFSGRGAAVLATSWAMHILKKDSAKVAIPVVE